MSAISKKKRRLKRHPIDYKPTVNQVLAKLLAIAIKQK
jgi:hypothetical protein